MKSANLGGGVGPRIRAGDYDFVRRTNGEVVKILINSGADTSPVLVPEDQFPLLPAYVREGLNLEV